MKKLTISPKTKEKVKKINEVVNTAVKKGSKKVAEIAKETSKRLADKSHEVSTEIERMTLHPVFAEDIGKMPDCFSTFSKDPKRAKAEACNGSLGHFVKAKKVNIYNIYPEYILKLEKNLKILFPKKFIKEMIYLVDPYQENQYIRVSDYFTYLRKCFVEELDEVGHSLGAKHVKIVYKEEAKTLINSNAKIDGKINNLNGKKSILLSGRKNYFDENTFSIEKDVKYSGGKPEPPILKYLKDEVDIKTLINQRISGKNRIKSKTYTINMGEHMKLDTDIVAGLDLVMKEMHISGSCSLTSEMENQNRTFLEYTYVF